jgi:hypothetical protein
MKNMVVLFILFIINIFFCIPFLIAEDKNNQSDLDLQFKGEGL